MDDETRLYLVALLTDLENEQFFGTLELGFRQGRVTVIKKSETLLPPTATNGHAKYTT